MVRSAPARELRPLVRTLDQVEHRASDHRPGRLGTAVQDQQAVGDGRVDGHVGRRPGRHHVVHRAALLLGVQLGRRLGELHRGEDAVVVQVPRPTAQDDRALRPLLQVVPAVLSEPQQLADHHRGQRRREIIDHLRAAALGLHGVEQARDLGSHVVLPHGHGLRREPTRHQVAALVVERIVEPDDRRVGRQVRSVAALLLVRVDEHVLALLDLDDVVVPGDTPELVRGVPVERGVLAHPRVGLVRPARVEAAVQQIDGPLPHGHARNLVPGP